MLYVCIYVYICTVGTYVHMKLVCTVYVVYNTTYLVGQYYDIRNIVILSVTIIDIEKKILPS